MEKRAHIRQPLDLDARIITSDHSAHNCGIKDFCLGGLFIACTGRSDAGDAHQHLPVVVGDQILVDFAIDLRGKPQFFRLQARVAGIFRGGIGVEFIEPDPGALLALQELASRTQHAGMQAAPSHPAPRAPGSPGGKTLTACRQVVSRYLKTHIEALFKQASDDMFVAARDAINDVDQRLCYDTLKEIEQLKAPIDRVFYGTVLDAMEQPGMPLKKRTSAQPEQLSGLSLLDSQEFQDMLTVQRILEKTEMRHQDQLFMLLKRLSQVAMVELNDQNNPVGPVGICAAFHDSLQHLGASRMARKSIFSAFENSVIKNLDDLYTELNEVLVSDNILPSIEKPTPHVPHRPSTPTGDSSVPESGDPEYEAAAPVEDIPGAMATQHARNGSASTIGPRRHATNTIPGQAPVNDYPPTPGAAPGLSQAGMQFTAPPPSATTEIAAEGYPPPSSNALHAAQCLLNLNRQIAGAAGRGEERAAAQTPPAHPPDTYTADEVIEALSSLQRGPISRPEAPSSLPDLKSRVLTSLAAGNTDKEAKQLGGPEGDAVEVIAGLVGSILEDVLVADGMKPRISRLEPPLLKVALQEDTFLSDEAHPARQVVNQLGRIDIPSVLEPGSQEAQLGVEVDRLIEHINANYDRNSSVFSEVLGQIEGLVERQSKLYLENLEQTIKSCDKEQKVLRGLRKGGGKKGRARRDRSNAAEKNLPPEWAQWMDRINRLKTGDVLGLEKPGGISRETLAWIDDERNKFIFVDTKGRKSSSIIGQELAMQLQRGKAKLLSEAELPAMERGLLSVVQGMHAQVAKTATHDPLTGLLGPKQFREQLEETLAHARRDHSEHILCHLDLDNFEAINKTCGRKAGDALLERLARVVEKQAGERGYVGRLEDDAFGVVLENCEPETGRRIADKYRQSVEQSRVLWKGRILPLSISIGVVSLTAETGDLNELQEGVRRACRQAFEAGGNLIKVLETRKPVARDIEPVDRITRILDENRLELFCQPVSPIGNQGQIKPHFEVLIRVRGEKGKITTPVEFIHEAERSGRMFEVDRWILHHALLWMSENKRRLLKVGGLALNLSGLSISDPGLTKFVLDELTSSKVPPGKVLFELTETAAIDQLSVAAEFMHLMKEYGCRFCLDDFGTGTSSYAYLKQLPVDYVKIDGLFVKDMIQDENDTAMVKSINEIGHFMGKKTIAEFVHNQDIVDRLKQIGVDYAQGFAIGEPAPLDDL